MLLKTACCGALGVFCALAMENSKETNSSAESIVSASQQTFPLADLPPGVIIMIGNESGNAINLMKTCRRFREMGFNTQKIITMRPKSPLYDLLSVWLALGKGFYNKNDMLISDLLVKDNPLNKFLADDVQVLNVCELSQYENEQCGFISNLDPSVEWNSLESSYSEDCYLRTLDIRSGNLIKLLTIGRLRPIREIRIPKSMGGDDRYLGYTIGALKHGLDCMYKEAGIRITYVE